MKRFLCFILAVSLIFCLSACKKEKNNDENIGDLYNLTECMNQGKMPEAKYTLGTDPDTIKQEGEGQEVYFNEGNRSSYYVVGDFYYYFENGAEDKGVSSIVCFSTAYGVEVNGYDSKEDVKAKFSYVTFEEREISSLEAYFVPHEIENWSALTCETENRRIDFIFQEDILVAVNLVDTENWTLT